MSIAYTICPECGLRIDLNDMKDFESLSSKEAFDHYDAVHPEKLEQYGPYATAMPYTPVLFD